VLHYVAPFSPGVSLEEDKARPFPELMEMAVLLSGIWCRLEKAGIAHGDIAPSNLLIRDSGEIDLIDIDNYALADHSVPPPQMVGQHAMLAPELRRSRNGGTNCTPNMESDRFAWGVLFNILLLGRHPADGLADTPDAIDQLMSSGQWPEEKRQPDPDEMPITALGKDLTNLFQKAFSIDPVNRPNAETWHKHLLAGLLNLHIHECGGAFVVDNSEGNCPWCGKKYQQHISTVVELHLSNLGTGEKCQFTLKDGAFVYLGRDSMAGMSPYVSGKHLRLYRQGQILHLEHIGSNPTTLRFSGETEAYNLANHREALNSPRLQQAVLKMADTVLEFRIAHAA